MNVVEYLKYAFDKGLPNVYRWLEDMLGIIASNHLEDDYVVIKDNKPYVKVEDGIYYIGGELDKTPIIDYKQKVKVSKGYLPNIHSDIETTVGRLLVNYLALVYPFGSKIGYINKEFIPGDVEALIAELRTDEETSDTKITVKEYITFVDTVIYMMNINNIIHASATPKLTTPPPGLKEYREKLIEEMKKKYGPHALEDKTVIAEIDNKLKEYDEKYIKDDPANGILLSGKTKNVARKKMFLMYGVGTEFVPSTKAKAIFKALYEGYDKDPDELEILFNDSRYASYSRGAETQKGGVVAKQSLRATQDIEIKDTDCRTKLYREIKVTDDNLKSLLHRFIIDSTGKTVELTQDNIGQYLNKTVKLRTPMGCQLEDGICLYCTSSVLRGRKNIVAIMASDSAGAILNESLKAMHETGIVKIAEMDVMKELI